MSQGKPQTIGEVDWNNEDRCLEKLRKRVLVVSRRKRVVRFVALVLITALGMGIIKEAVFWVTTIYR